MEEGEEYDTGIFIKKKKSLQLGKNTWWSPNLNIRWGRPFYF